jgi:hypothetical protein
MRAFLLCVLASFVNATLAAARTFVFLVLAIAVLFASIQLYGGVFAALTAVLMAGLLFWPDVQIRAYFTTARAVLPLAAFGFGVTAQFAFERLADPLKAIGWGVVSACLLSRCIAIFEERIMASTFAAGADGKEQP